MYSFPNFESVHCSMSSSNCHFLTNIQISQEAGKVVWYSHLFKNFPQFVVIHTVKGFSAVTEAELMFFWNFLAFSMIQRFLASWSLVPLPFLSLACTSTSEVLSSHIVEDYRGGFWAQPCYHVKWVPFCSSLNNLWHCNSLGLEGKLTFSSPVATEFRKLLSFLNLLSCWVQYLHSIIF